MIIFVKFGLAVDYEVPEPQAPSSASSGESRDQTNERKQAMDKEQYTKPRLSGLPVSQDAQCKAVVHYIRDNMWKYAKVSEIHLYGGTRCDASTLLEVYWTQDRFIEIDQNLQADFNAVNFEIRDLEWALTRIQKEAKGKGTARSRSSARSGAASDSKGEQENKEETEGEAQQEGKEEQNSEEAQIKEKLTYKQDVLTEFKAQIAQFRKQVKHFQKVGNAANEQFPPRTAGKGRRSPIADSNDSDNANPCIPKLDLRDESGKLVGLPEHIEQDKKLADVTTGYSRYDLVELVQNESTEQEEPHALLIRYPDLASAEKKVSGVEEEIPEPKDPKKKKGKK